MSLRFVRYRDEFCNRWRAFPGAATVARQHAGYPANEFFAAVADRVATVIAHTTRYTEQDLMTPLPLPPQPVPWCVIVLVIVAASTDIVTRRIPNRLIAIGLVAALGVQVGLHGLAGGALAWLAGAACGFALLLPFYLVRGMAAGDVKLLLTIGAWVGPAMTFHIALVTLLIGGVWSVAIVLGRRRFAQLMVNLGHLLICWRATPQATLSGASLTTSVGSIPYGVAIAAGTLGMLYAATFQ